MKSKSKPFDPIQGVINQSIDFLDKKKRYFEDSVKWLKISYKQLRKTNECLEATFPKTEQKTNMHGQISGVLFRDLDKLSKCIQDFNIQLKSELDKANAKIEEFNNSITQIKGDFRTEITELVGIYVEMKNDLQGPNKSTNTTEFFKHGFDNHSSYLKYFKLLTDNQNEFMQAMNEMKILTTDLKTYQRELIKLLNVQTAGTFTLAESQRSQIGKNDSYQQEDEKDQAFLADKDEIITDNFELYRAPTIKIPDEYKFDQKKAVDMDVIESFQGEPPTEIEIKKGETVTVIDASLAEYWKIRKMGVEGYVPAKCLGPKQT